MPITMLAVQFWAFCAPTSRAGGDRWLHPGADGRRSGHVRDIGSRESTTGLRSQGVAWSSPAGLGGGVENRSEAGL
jgi:hypothetical protein